MTGNENTNGVVLSAAAPAELQPSDSVTNTIQQVTPGAITIMLDKSNNNNVG